MYQHHKRQGADIVIEVPKHDPLMKWPTWGYVTVWNFYISIFVRFTANKLGRLLTLGRIFIMQTLKSSPSSCSFSSSWQDFGWTEKFFLHMFYLLLLLTLVNRYSLDTPANSFVKVPFIIISGASNSPNKCKELNMALKTVEQARVL